MDPRRFDSLTVALVRASRRQVLTAVATGAGTALLTRFRSPSTAAAPRRCNGTKCVGHEACCPVFDCSGAVCVATPGCVNLRTDPFQCGGCNRECDEECCKGECCFSSSGQVCRPQGCACADPQLTRCGASCVDLDTDPFNCGACGASCCGTTCTGQEVCVSGHCV